MIVHITRSEQTIAASQTSGEQFLEALAQDFAEHGPAAIVACREEKPTEYVKVVASLLPKKLLVRKDPVDELRNEERIAACADT